MTIWGFTSRPNAAFGFGCFTWIKQQLRRPVIEAEASADPPSPLTTVSALFIIFATSRQFGWVGIIAPLEALRTPIRRYAIVVRRQRIYQWQSSKVFAYLCTVLYSTEWNPTSIFCVIKRIWIKLSLRWAYALQNALRAWAEQVRFTKRSWLQNRRMAILK